MSIEKSQARMQAARDVGERIDDAIEAAEREALRVEGGIEWLKRALPIASDAQRRVEAEVEAGRLDLETSKLLKDALLRVALDIGQLGTAAGAELQAARGRVGGLKVAVAITKQAFTVEAARVERAVADAAAEAAAATLPVPPELLEATEAPARRQRPVRETTKAKRRRDG